MANRFRVIRTIDIATSCFPERGYKASLTAAQRAVRGMVKTKVLARYRTDRFQTVYGLAKAGADWLEERGVTAAPSVRRVSDMRNPEHRLWLQFLVVASEARGLKAWTEYELLRELNAGRKGGATTVQGLLSVSWTARGRAVCQHLRPDAVAFEADGVTWFEADISKRGASREAALAALACAIGQPLAAGGPLRRVVVYCKSERIRKRALAVVANLVTQATGQVLVGDRVHFRPAEEGVFEVWRGREEKLRDGRIRVADQMAGHLLIQRLPIWLPKLRLEDGRTPIEGWFTDGALPYSRPASSPKWAPCATPLLGTAPDKQRVSTAKTDSTKGKST